MSARNIEQAKGAFDAETANDRLARIRETLAEFGAEHADSDYTDTGDLWDMIDRVYEIAGGDGSCAA
jgi:hypothetical protein